MLGLRSNSRTNGVAGVGELAGCSQVTARLRVLVRDERVIEAAAMYIIVS
jgi:hypothetical protein